MKQTYTEYLRCEFTDTEIAEAAKELARANSRKASIEQQKKDVDAQLKSEIVAQETIIGRLAAQINTGSEYRNIECRLELDTPEPGKKRVIRLDTGEEVSVKPMNDSDRQMVLDLQSQAEAAEAEAAKAKEPIVPPAPYVPRLDAPMQVGEGIDVVLEFDPANKGGDSIENQAPLGPTLAPARTQGGTHQKGAKGRKPRNQAAESFADGSGANEQEFTPEEGSE